MEFAVPEPIQVESRSMGRLILALPLGNQSEFVTIDFERRRWQLGNHPHRILNFISTLYRGRNWKKEIVADAIRGLLSKQSEEVQREAGTEIDGTLIPGEKSDLPLPEPKATVESSPEPGPSITYAWKRIVDGQISQDINAPTPEDLFKQAGFRPHRVLEPIQGFLCVPVQRRDERWIEIPGSF